MKMYIRRIFSLKNENFEAITTKCHSSALLFEPRKKKLCHFSFFPSLSTKRVEEIKIMCEACNEQGDLQ